MCTTACKNQAERYHGIDQKTINCNPNHLNYIKYEKDSIICNAGKRSSG